MDRQQHPVSADTPRTRSIEEMKPGTDRMARPDGQAPPRPIGHRPTPVSRPRPRRTVSPTDNARSQTSAKTTTRLTACRPLGDHRDLDADAPKWSHHTGAGWSHKGGRRQVDAATRRSFEWCPGKSSMPHLGTSRDPGSATQGAARHKPITRSIRGHSGQSSFRPSVRGGVDGPNDPVANGMHRSGCEALFGVGIQRTTKVNCGRLPTWHSGSQPRNRTKAS